MRIYNKQNHQVFFSFAGINRRGVWLGPDKRSPELPPARLSNPALQNALKRGLIGVLLSPADKVAARGVVPDAILELAVGTGPATGSFDIDREKKRLAAEDAKEAEAAKAAEDAEAAKDAADAAAEEAKEAAANAAREKAEAKAAKNAQEEAEATAKDAADVAGKEAAEAEDAEEEAVAKATVAEKAKQYSKMKKSELLDLCLQRGLAANPGMPVVKLREMLSVNDKVFE